MISLHEPTFDEQDERYVLETLRSTWVSTGGPCVEQFEKNFAKYVGSSHAISTCNGTVAIQLMIEVLKRKNDLEESFDVIIPSLTFIATANAIVHAGGFPIFVDVEKNSFQISAIQCENLIKEQYDYESHNKMWFNKKTKRPLLAIMPVHIMGYMASVVPLLNLAKEYGFSIIEDAAEALGVFDVQGKHAGTFGLTGAFSFNGNKILTTGGGGMIVTNDKETATYLKHISTTAKVDNLRFVHDEVGYNYRMINVLAALGLSQLDKLALQLTRKKNIFNQYKNFLNQNDLYVYEQDNCISNFWLINVIFSTHEKREKALYSLIEKNIQARPLWTPCHLQPAYQHFMTNKTSDFSSTDEMWRRTLSLPSSPKLTNDEVKKISEIINQCD